MSATDDGRAAPPMAFPDNPLWDYATALYGRDGVAAACLALQDRCGLDVNMLLYCCWRAAAGHAAMTQAGLAAADQNVRSWNRDIVGGLRAARQTLKGGLPPAPQDLAAELRARILDIELGAERIEQQILFAATPPPPKLPPPTAERAGNAAANLAGYLRLRDVAPDKAAHENLELLLGAAFPGADCTTLF